MDNFRIIYYPACKVDDAFPESAAKVKAYLAKRWGMEIAGCCRIDKDKLKASDIPVVLCHTCAAILEESSAAKKVEYVWKYIDKDESFVFPDYNGERITLQDCIMAKQYPEIMEIVRSLLKKMHFEIVELPLNRLEANFCGLLTTPILEANAKLAPKRFGKKNIFTPMLPEERKRYLKDYVAQYSTPRTVCYCKACHGALQQGDAKAVHLLELLFPKK